MSNRFGRYIAESLLGRGGMGTVYRGRDPELDRVVAIKVLTPSAAIPEAFRLQLRERFLREARSAAGLSHPNIVPVYDIGVTADGDPFLVMELVAGTSLEATIKAQGALASNVVARIGCEIAGALAAAHAAGIVHRDVKPANILIDASGTAKLMDFGLAQIADSTLTVEGQFLGSPLYAPPEQIRGHKVGPPADSYALALSLYVALTAKHPFARKTAPESVRAIVQDPVPLVASMRAGVDPAWDAVFERALAKTPEDRFADAAGLAAACAAVGRQPGLAAVAAAPPPTPSGAPAAKPSAELRLVVETGAERGRSVLLAGPIRVGRGTGALALSDASVSTNHCVFERVDDAVEVRDVGSTNGTYVGDQRVTLARLRAGDCVRLGTGALIRVVAGDSAAAVPAVPVIPPTTGTVLDAELPTAAIPRSRLRPGQLDLIIEAGPRAGTILSIGESLVLSRDEGEGRLDDPKASRKHAIVESRGSRVYLRDLASTNGTWLADQRIREVELRDGDRFRVGSTVLRLRSLG